MTVLDQLMMSLWLGHWQLMAMISIQTNSSSSTRWQMIILQSLHNRHNNPSSLLGPSSTDFRCGPGWHIYIVMSTHLTHSLGLEFFWQNKSYKSYSVTQSICFAAFCVQPGAWGSLCLRQIWYQYYLVMQFEMITDKLQRLLNAVARVVSDTQKFDRGLSTLLHDELHWLDVPEKVTFKLCLMTYHCLHGQAPRYLADHVTPAIEDASWHRLRFANWHRLIVPRCQLNTYGRRVFPVAGPTVWNSPPEIQCVISIDLNYSLKRFYSVFASATSALEVLFNVMGCRSLRFTLLTSLTVSDIL